MANPNKQLSMSEQHLQFQHGAAKIDTENNESNEDHKLIKISRCCICFEKYTLNTRAPICMPCGHSFCTICIRKIIHGKLVCCCICRKITFFGPHQLGKNIQLLDILEKMKLLDPDEKRNPFETSVPAEATSYPENIVEGVEDRDMYNFFEFCFDFVKKFYEEKQEKTLTNLAMYNNGIRFHEMTQHTIRMTSSREQLATSMDLLLTKFDECLQTMKAVESGNNSIMPRISQMPESRSDEVFLDFNQMDPFGLEAHANSNIEFMENLNSSTPIGVFSFYDPDNSFSADISFEDAPSINRRPQNHGNQFREFNNEFRDISNDNDGFRPGLWEPLSRLFNLPRV